MEEKNEINSEVFNLTKDTLTVKEVAKICKKLSSSGHEIIIISSGAIGAGIKLINTSSTQALDKNQTSIKPK